MSRATDTKRSHPGRTGAVIAMIGCAVSLAACGASSKHPSGAGAGIASIRFSQCMRADGVPNFPDLNGHGMLIQSSGQALSVNGVSVNAPAFGAARAKCQRYLPAQSVASAPQPARALARTLNFARCMRKHGVTNFPDPKPTTTQGGNSVVDLRNSGLNFYSPAFLAASKTCGGGPKGP